MGIQPNDLAEEMRLRLKLPTCYAGLSVNSISHVIPLARAAELVEIGPAVRAEVASWVSSVALDPRKYDGVDQALAEGLSLMLAAHGISGIGGGGKPVAADQPQATDPFRSAVPEKHLLSQYLEHISVSAIFFLYPRGDASQKTRLLSASGPTAGTSFVALLSTPRVNYTDMRWSEAVRWRLAVPSPGPASTCQNSRSNGDLCGELLDATGNHAVSCDPGPLRTFRHNDLSDIYAEILEEVGAVVRQEAFVPEFSTAKEAWLDVWAYGLPELSDLLLDLTVRHPSASRYQPGAARQQCYTAEEAAREKEAKYAAAGGRSVWPIAHGTWGRLGSLAEELLAKCAGIAARRAHRRGRAPGNPLRRWRAQLDAALHRDVAAQLVAARHGLPGKQRRRPAPADRAGLEARCPFWGADA